MSDTAKPSESVRDTLEAAFEATEAATPERPPARPQALKEGPSRAEPSARDEKPFSEPVEAAEAPSDGAGLVPPAGDRPRDQFGRFTSATPEGPTPDAETQTAGPQEIADQPETEAAAPDHMPASSPPRSWSETAQKDWATASPALREAVMKREAEMSRGAEQWAQQRNALEPIAQAVAPYAQKYALRGQHPAMAVQQLLAVQDLLERDPVEGIAYVARSYGVDLRQYAAAYDQATRSQQPQDPQVRQLSEQLAQVQGYLQQQANGQQQQEMSRIQHEIMAFESDAAAHPYFAAVRPAMAQLMQTGVSASLQDAYDHACWAIPEIRARLLQEQRRAESTQRSKSERDAAERARRAGVSVSGAPSTTNGAVRKQDSGSVRDTLNQVYEAVVSR
jgi:hypothetical protein